MLGLHRCCCTFVPHKDVKSQKGEIEVVSLLSLAEYRNVPYKINVVDYCMQKLISIHHSDVQVKISQ